MGPAAIVLTKESSDKATLAPLRALIAAVSSSIQGEDFWVGPGDELGCAVKDGRPFMVTLGLDEYEQDDELAKLEAALGWTPKGAIGFAAMCKDGIDHEILARLCLKTLDLFDHPLRVRLGSSDVEYLEPRRARSVA